VLEQGHGLQLPRWLQIDFSTVVQKYAEQSQSEVTPAAIWDLFKSHYLENKRPLNLTAFEVRHTGGRDHLMASLSCDNEALTIRSEGAGVVESFVGGLSDTLGQELVLVDYSEHAVTNSVNSEAACYVQMNIAGIRYSGVGLSRDIVDATLSAILCAVNRFLQSTGGSLEQLKQRQACAS